jgi:hypothetical protein
VEETMMMKAKAEDEQPVIDATSVGSILATCVVMMNGHIFRNPRLSEAERLACVTSAHAVLQRTHQIVMDGLESRGVVPAWKLDEAEVEKTAKMFAAKLLEVG